MSDAARSSADETGKGLRGVGVLLAHALVTSVRGGLVGPSPVVCDRPMKRWGQALVETPSGTSWPSPIMYMHRQSTRVMRWAVFNFILCAIFDLISISISISI